MKKIAVNILIIIWVILTIPVTFFLIHYNDHDVTEVGGKTYIISNKLKGYKDNTLIVVSSSKYNKGDQVFYYNESKHKEKISVGEITSIKDSKTYIISGEELFISSDNIIGNKKNSKEYKTLGSILSVVTSKYGYLFIILMPLVILFLLEVYFFIWELKSKQD